MKLCFGSYATVLKVCMSETVTQRMLINTLVNLIDKNAALNEDGLEPVFSKLMNCKADFNTKAMAEDARQLGHSRTSIKTLVLKVQTRDILMEFHEEITGRLSGEGKRAAIDLLREILREDHDAYYAHRDTFYRFMGYTAHEACTKKLIHVSEFLCGLFLYSVYIGENNSKDGQETVNFVKKIKMTGTGSFPNSEFEYDDEIPSPDITISFPDCKDYLLRLKDKYSKVRTLLDKEPTRNLYDFFVPNHLEREYLAPCDSSRKLIVCTEDIDDITLDNLFAISSFLILSGTGGLGKSMMMRHLLMQAIDNCEETGIIPAFLLLKDYDEDESDGSDS